MTRKTQASTHVDEDLESKYEILESLGGGGMGRVLRARHRQLKRLVAIKLLHQDLRGSESVTRFLREARAAAQIRSVHVAHVMDAGILRSGQPYIVMEYLQGQDLSRLVATQGRLPVEQAVDYTLQALEALAEAHALEIIHRDIKPGNLFATRVVTGDTAIKVVDFGLAKTSHALDTLDPGVTERGAVLGTPSYMAPEQFVDAQDVDARADIWGVGASLFELLTGVPPFRGGNLPQIYTAVMHQPIAGIRSVVPELSAGLEEVVGTCLTRDRNQRYDTVAQLAAALAPFGADGASARAQRIQRISDGVRDSADSNETSVSGEREIPVPATTPGTISSTFARAPKNMGGNQLEATPRRSSRKVLFGVAVIGAVVAFAILAIYMPRTPAVVHGSKPTRSAERAVEPSLPTRTTGSSLEQSVQAATDPGPSTPLAAAAAVQSATPIDPPASVVGTSAAPPAKTVSPRTAKKRRRNTLPETSPAPKRPSGGIYEQYP